MSHDYTTANNAGKHSGAHIRNPTTITTMAIATNNSFGLSKSKSFASILAFAFFIFFNPFFVFDILEYCEPYLELF